MTAGWSKDQRSRWPRIIGALDGSLDAPALDALTEARLADLGRNLVDLEREVSPSDVERKQRRGIVKHLKRVLERQVRGSTLHPFGSAETGLVLRRGDVDLCLIVKDLRKPKGVLRHLANVLESEDYRDIQTIGRAKVPIVKFTDPTTGIPVDLSLNNALALRNTELIGAYVDMDPRVKTVALAVKHWALQRGLANAFRGTLSSYAWTVLVLRHLQSVEAPVVPNLQAGEPRRIESYDGRTHDTTVLHPEGFEPGTASAAELFASFFHRWFVQHPWDERIVSLREADDPRRSKRRWPAPKAGPVKELQGAVDRMGHHVMAIEDPFDLQHDLSRVVRAEGWADLMEEGLRMWEGLVDGTDLSALLAPVDGLTLAPDRPKGLFDDLQGMDKERVAALLATKRAELSVAQERVDALVAEREESIRLSKAMRGALKDTEGMSQDIRDVARGLRTRAAEMDEAKALRDAENKRLVLPKSRIEEELKRLYHTLTNEVDVFRVPSLEREQRDFSRFFELQAMHRGKAASDAHHQRYIELLQVQREEVKKIRTLEKDRKQAHADLLKEEPGLKEVRVRSGDVDEYDRRANRISRLLKDRRKERKRLSREVGRLEAFLKGGPQRGGAPRRGAQRGNGRGGPRRPRVDVKEVRERAQTGGTLSLADLGALLDQGGLPGAKQDGTQSKRHRHKSDRQAASRRRNDVKQRRGKRGKGPRSPRE
ncbi:MAG TPA: hypothetical protein HA286_03515 [Candidatus Poseidoniaceae archaeon]|mgnify:CR=1 FL=1|nr:MAG TPA: hypothetical protein D7H96_03450 [Candidatus Poseidoniales archaeon]HIH53326.1 hypothetical protein [Candidatus Poseidoniaceae archaeon]